MNLETGNSSYDNMTTFDNNWKWINYVSSKTEAERIAIGYTGYTASGGTYITNFVVAVFGPCRMYDVRKFMKDKGCASIALYLDGGGSTSAKNQGTIVDTASRRIPVIVSM
jgi:hypothetical protein